MPHQPADCLRVIQINAFLRPVRDTVRISMLTGEQVMAANEHGVSIGIERTGDTFYLCFKATGTLTHEDYEIITPMIESALAGVTHPHIRAFVDCTDLDGWDLHAAWDDFKLGMRYRGDFTRVALLARKGWQEKAAVVGNWFLSGEVKCFEDAPAAKAWLLAPEESAA